MASAHGSLEQIITICLMKAYYDILDKELEYSETFCFLMIAHFPR